MGSKLPFIKWFARDWLTDEALGMATVATRGIWHEMLLYMHVRNSDHLTGSLQGLSRLCRSTAEEVSFAVQEMMEFDIAEITRENGDALDYSEMMDITKAPRVTIMSRRRHKELQNTEGAKLRKRKQRAKEDVSQDSHVSVTSMSPSVSSSVSSSSKLDNKSTRTVPNSEKPKEKLENHPDVEMILDAWRQSVPKVAPDATTQRARDWLLKRLGLKKGKGVGAVDKTYPAAALVRSARNYGRHAEEIVAEAEKNNTKPYLYAVGNFWGTKAYFLEYLVQFTPPQPKKEVVADTKKPTPTQPIENPPIPENLEDCSGDWIAALKILKEMVDEENFETWFTEIECLGLHPDKPIVFLQAPSAYNCSWLDRYYTDKIIGAFDWYEPHEIAWIVAPPDEEEEIETPEATTELVDTSESLGMKGSA